MKRIRKICQKCGKLIEVKRLPGVGIVELFELCDQCQATAKAKPETKPETPAETKAETSTKPKAKPKKGTAKAKPKKGRKAKDV